MNYHENFHLTSTRFSRSKRVQNSKPGFSKPKNMCSIWNKYSFRHYPRKICISTEKRQWNTRNLEKNSIYLSEYYVKIILNSVQKFKDLGMSQLCRNKRGNFKTLESLNNNVFKDILIGVNSKSFGPKMAEISRSRPKISKLQHPFVKFEEKN